MHCASLGEFEQGRPLLEELKKQFPSYPVILSFFSPSGFEIRKNYPGADKVIYLPVDSASNAKKLIGEINPAIVFWVKYEYWFHYLFELKQRKIPVLLVSGIFRDSQPFFKPYGSIWRRMLGFFDHLFVQNEDSIALLHSIGIRDNVSGAGDTRFDRVIEIAEKKENVPYISAFVQGHPVLIAGSTWEDDEIELIHYVKLHPQTRFIIAPHEIDTANLQDVKKEFNNSIFYSDLGKGPVPDHINVLIIDNIGMLSRLYQYADVAYIGGGFGSDGIHNTLEAAVYAKPVVFGPVYKKFAEARGLVEAGGAFSISNALELEKLLDGLFHDQEMLQRASLASKEYVYRMRGATRKIIGYVEEKRLLTS
jgi:3-deoxy-D-manno-octulosonic-acid transferase